jgi:two-component system chemotaxis sensor kinase CheA
MVALPDEVIARFRELALEAVARIESGWNALVDSPSDAALGEDLRRDLHTLKGDARTVGFTDVHLLCHKLEDLFELANDRRYKVHEEFDVVVTMACGFLSMLLRSNASAPLKGIDLPGFIVSLDQVLAEERLRSVDDGVPSPVSPPSSPMPEAGDRISSHRRAALAAIATDVFVASLAAPSPLNERLRQSWRDLKGQVSSLAEVSLDSRLDRHAAAARELARTLGKEVEVIFEVGDIRAPPDVVAALEVAVLHALRNALDHGIESTEERLRLGKSPTASIVVRAAETDDAIVLTVEDDGKGIDFERVSERARELGLPQASQDALVDLLFKPGFSTTRRVTDLSGRGVGLDAARAAVEKQRGTITLAPRQEAGASMTVRFARARRYVDVLSFIAGGSIPVAVATQWALEESTTASESSLAVDVRGVLGIGGLAAPSTGLPHTTLKLTRGDTTLFLRGGHVEREPFKAERVCPTSDACPYEIVIAGDTEYVLLRPEVVTAGDPYGAISLQAIP